MPSRSDRYNKKKRKSKTRRIITVIAVILLFIVAGLGVLAFKVYNDVTSTTENMYAEVEKEEVRPEAVNVDSGQEPFSVLLLGVDTGDLGRTEQGRSDTMMVMTVNPNTNESTIVSIPRDTYTEIIGRGTMDKINHAYAFGGASMSINTVQNLFDIPIDYYVEVNMKGLKDIIDAVGGVEVTPTLTFSYEGYSFTEGVPVTLDGDAALSYSRMRYDDPNGDYGRQQRQRQVIEAVIKKVASFSSIMNYQGVLGTLENNMATNLSFPEMVDIFNHYRGAASNINQVQLTGTGQKMNGIYYDIIPDEELQRVSDILKEQLEI
ncbi:LCP family protein [Atopococcus tabaci]|uniref:LCP family glycopolymer transferase n=1 Tax=Atopococcus tabaci TaxID=269774 RepID=UPI000489288B|nr:LCP family protein [Atopococcus tabaci]